MPEQPPSTEMVEPKEVTHSRFYDAFHAWFMQSGCDFWSECDAPESLATIAVELNDAFAARAVAEERARCLAWVHKRTFYSDWSVLIEAIRDGRPAP